MKFDGLMRGDFAQLKFETTENPSVSEDLWVKVKRPTNKRDEYWAVLDDSPELIANIPIDYQPIFKPCHVVDCITYAHAGMAGHDVGFALVDLWGNYWGEYKRSDEGDYPIQCSFGQIQDRHDLGVLGDGCFLGNKSLRQFNKGISYKNTSKSQQEFEKAWKSSSEYSQKVLWAHYAAKATLPERVVALGITVYEYFPTLRVAQEEILGVIVRNGASPNER